MNAEREPRSKEHPPSMLRYVAVWIALLGLTATSYGTSRLHLGGADVFVAFAIALVKSGLVLLFFMHLVERPRTTVIAPFVGLAFVALLVSLVVVDVSTRHTFPAAPLPMAPEGDISPAPPAGGPLPGATQPPRPER
jgi:cytochrome c oxidase subunit 4